MLLPAAAFLLAFAWSVLDPQFYPNLWAGATCCAYLPVGRARATVAV
jgi:hypothetical protein